MVNIFTKIILTYGLVLSHALAFDAEFLYKHHPELSWLAEEGIICTQEGNALERSGSFSAQLLSRSAVELDRTLLALQVEEWVRMGSKLDYEAFTQSQSTALCLSWEEFQLLHCRWQSVLQNMPTLSPEQVTKAAQVALILGDMGKTAVAHEKLLPLGVSAVDHDDFYLEALCKAPDALPSYAALPGNAQYLLKTAAGLGHFGHMTHLEGGSQMWANLAQSKILDDDPLVFDFAWMTHVFDVAGALGHQTSLGSLSYNALTHQALEATYEASLMAKEGTSAAFQSYLNTRLNWLHISCDRPHSDILGRLGAMMRLYNQEDGVWLMRAWELLLEQAKSSQDFDQNAAQAVLSSFSKESFENLPADTTYIPAFLVNLINNPAMGVTREERIKTTVLLGLPVMAYLIIDYKKALQEGACNPQSPLNANDLAGRVKGGDVKEVLRQMQLCPYFLMDS